MEKKGIPVSIGFVALLVASLLAYLAWAPRKMNEFDGYKDQPMTPEQVKRFTSSLRGKIQIGRSVTITEKELNRYLSGAFPLNQSSFASKWAQPNAIYANLTDDHIDLCLERVIKDRLHHTQVTIEVKSETTRSDQGLKQKRSLTAKHGKIGKLKLPSTISQGFNAWYNTFSHESEKLLKTIGATHSDVVISDGKIVIVAPPKNRSPF